MTTSTTLVTYISSQNIKRLINYYFKMETKIQKEYVEMFMENLTIKYNEKNAEKAEKREETLKKLVKEMMLSTSYDAQRFQQLMLLTTPYVEKYHISLDMIAKVMTEHKYDFLQSSLRIKFINNLQGYVDVYYKISKDSTYENTCTCYFSDLAKVDEKFKMFLNYE